MASPSANPRRTAVNGSSGLSLKTNVVLRKGATFYSPASPDSGDSTFFLPPQLPRSQTSLDDVLDAHRRRVAITLDSIDKTLAGTHLTSPKKTVSPKAFFDDTHSVPRGILDHTIVPGPSSTAERRVLSPRSINRRLANNNNNHQHESDSGLGSSIASSSRKSAGKSGKRSSQVQATAVTRSATSITERPAGLSPRATSRIYEYTVKPLLAKPSFKVFHPLLLECTTKINKKDIVCLRDVEKTILLLAPERTKVAKLYLEFCLESVRCLQSTVEYLSDRERTRPSDAPYTAGYFIDLVDQIRHYAQQLADAKEKENSGIADSMHPTSTDEIKLHGGITVNGRPAELVRIDRDGRAVSIATGLPVELEEDIKDTIRIKRSASQELQDEEEIMRSMARRKKNAPPEEYAPKMCSVPGCTKMFKRPCDLTKHEKTHSRPWKCPIPSCKYHEYGWPTEKEKDRHLNDKHSDNPPMYECLFKPCTYKSKRDSNRKQHMEKTHGWKYVRTKTNGTTKGKKDSPSMEHGSPEGSSNTEPTPQLVNLPTPVSAQSPAVATPLLDEFSAPLYANALDFPTCVPSDILAATDIDIPAQIDDFDFSPLDNASPATDSSLDNNSAYQDIGQDTTMYEDIYSAPMQLPTPEPNVFNTKTTTLLDQFMALSAADLCAPMITPEQQLKIQRLEQIHQQMQQQQQQQLMTHISPLGEGNMMLYTPETLVDDEGFCDFQEEPAKKGDDFILFPPSNPIMKADVFDNLFDEIPPSLAAGYSQPTSQIFPNMDW